MYLNLGFSILNNFSSKKSLKTSRAGTCCQDRTHRAVSGCRPRCLGLGSQAQVLSLVLGFSEPEVSPVAGVRVMPHGKQPVRNREPQVIFVEFD